MSEYAWAPTMGTISDVGGDFEQGCRAMFLAGVLWLHGHPDADPAYVRYVGKVGGQILIGTNDDGRELSRVVQSAATTEVATHDRASLVLTVILDSCLFVHAYGWDEYVATMEAISKPPQEKP